MGPVNSIQYICQYLSSDKTLKTMSPMMITIFALALVGQGNCQMPPLSMPDVNPDQLCSWNYYEKLKIVRVNIVGKGKMDYTVDDIMKNVNAFSTVLANCKRDDSL